MTENTTGNLDVLSCQLRKACVTREGEEFDTWAARNKWLPLPVRVFQAVYRAILDFARASNEKTLVRNGRLDDLELTPREELSYCWLPWRHAERVYGSTPTTAQIGTSPTPTYIRTNTRKGCDCCETSSDSCLRSASCARRSSGPRRLSRRSYSNRWLFDN